MARTLKEAIGVFSNARIVCVTADEAEGELTIHTKLDKSKEIDIVYEGMYYTQIDESTCGIIVNNVDTITLKELRRERYSNALNKLYNDCTVDEAFLLAMEQRGSRFFVHHTSIGEFIVLAKRLALGESTDNNNMLE